MHINKYLVCMTHCIIHYSKGYTANDMVGGTNGSVRHIFSLMEVGKNFWDMQLNLVKISN